MKKKSILLSSMALLIVVTTMVAVFIMGGEEKVEATTLSSQKTIESTTATTTATEPSQTDSDTHATTTSTTATSTTKFSKETTTKKKTSSTKKETTTKKPSVAEEPDFEYISKVTIDGVTYYKRYDATYNECYYTDATGFRKYAEEAIGEMIRPSAEEIYANPVSKVTINGVTWYKYYTGNGSTRYLTSDGRDMTGIDIGVQTYGKDSITVDGVTFYKTYVEGVGYEYYDSNGNYLLYDASYCHACGENDCTRSMSTYYCVICKENVSPLECHPSDHFDASH